MPPFATDYGDPPGFTPPNHGRLATAHQNPLVVFDPDSKIPGEPMPDLVVIAHSRIALPEGGSRAVYAGEILRGLDQANGWALVSNEKAMLATDANIAIANARRDPWQLETKKGR